MSQNRPVVYVHIGAPKTGTTYVQDLLWQNRAKLRRDGLLVPGERRPAHYWAGMDLRRNTFRGYRPPPVSGAWRRLVDEVHAWNATAVIDDELLSRADAAEVDRALGDLDFAEVHLVYSVRDMARLLPAAWQERVKNQAGASPGFAEFLAAVRREDDRESDSARWFWSAHDMPAVLARWSRALPAEHVHVLTVPPSGTAPDVLWGRFAGLLGLDPYGYEVLSDRGNLSLGAVEAEVLRRVNGAFGATAMTWPAYHHMVKRCLTPALARRRGSRIALPEWAYDWASTWAEQATKAVAEARYDVVGDLSEILPAERPSGQDPDATSPDEQLDAAVEGMTALLEGWQATRSALVDARARAARAESRLARTRSRMASAERQARRDRKLSPRQRLRRCLVELSEQVGWLGTARRGYRRVRGAVRRRR